MGIDLTPTCHARRTWAYDAALAVAYVAFLFVLMFMSCLVVTGCGVSAEARAVVEKQAEVAPRHQARMGRLLSFLLACAGRGLTPQELDVVIAATSVACETADESAKGAAEVAKELR